MNKPQWIIIHVTGTPPSMTEVDAAWVDRLHRRQGWMKAGYQEVITRDGHRQNARGGYPVRRLDEPGAHVGGCGAEWNRKTIGISLAGGVDESGAPEDNRTEAQNDALMEAIREYCAEFDIPWSRVIGHRDLIKITNAAPKACPCFSVQEWLVGRRAGGDFMRPNTNPADTIRVPPTHTIKAGNTLWGISNTYGVPIETLHKLNPKVRAENLIPGTQLKLTP